MLVKLTGVKKLGKKTMKHIKGGCTPRICLEDCGDDSEIRYALDGDRSSLVDIIIRLPI